MSACSSGGGSAGKSDEPTSGGYGSKRSDFARAIANDPHMEIAAVSYDEWLYANFDKAERMAQQVAGDPGAPPVARIEAEKTLVLVFLSKGDEAAAREAISRMLDLDPTARFSPEGKYPPVVYEFFHDVKDELPAGTMDIRTIAVGDFENNSIYVKQNDKYDYDLFRPALVHAIITDLSTATGLKIVDRQRTEKIVEETQLGQSGAVDPEQAVRAGKLLGAHCFVFGQYMILDKKKVRIDMRVVHTATGEILVAKQITGEFKGKPEKFLELEQQLVTTVAGAVDEVARKVTGEPAGYRQAAEIHFDLVRDEVKDRDNYAEAQFLIGEAVRYEENREYDAARDAWEQVLEVDPENEDARQRVLVLAQATG